MVRFPRSLCVAIAAGVFLLLSATAITIATAVEAGTRPLASVQASAPLDAAEGDAVSNAGSREDGEAQSPEDPKDLVKAGWVYLFDSRVPTERHAWNPLALWRVRNPDQPDRNHWSVVVEDGERVLKNEIGRGDHGTDLISLQEFWDFDLHAEVRVSSNSGIYLRGRYEIQIDDTSPEKENLRASDLGGIYSVRAPSTNAAKGRGVWQTIDASIRGYTITVRLNGELIQSEVEIPEDRRRGTGSELGRRDGVSGDPESPGPIFVQGDHGTVELRNIRVRPVGGMAANAKGSATGPRASEEKSPR